MPQQIRGLPDHLRADRVYYLKELLVWAATEMFVLCLGSKRQLRLESSSKAFVANLNALAGTSVEVAAHDDTLVYYLRRLPPEPFEELPAGATERLIRIPPEAWEPQAAHSIQIRFDSS